MHAIVTRILKSVHTYYGYDGREMTSYTTHLANLNHSPEGPFLHDRDTHHTLRCHSLTVVYRRVVHVGIRDITHDYR